MSRSRRKTPVFNKAGRNGRKKDRQTANRIFRRKEKMIISSLHDETDKGNLPECVAEVSDVWSWDCDGWGYWKEAPEQFYRK